MLLSNKYKVHNKLVTDTLLFVFQSWHCSVRTYK